jgi:hypothetical protein
MRILKKIFFIVGFICLAWLYLIIIAGPPPNNSDEAVNARMAKAKHDLSISNYHEQLVTVAGFASPVGLDISFDIKQKSFDYTMITLEVPPYDIHSLDTYDQWQNFITMTPWNSHSYRMSLLECRTIDEDRKMESYGPFNTLIQDKPIIHVHYLCTPRYTLLPNKDISEICVVPKPLHELTSTSGSIPYASVMLDIGEKSKKDIINQFFVRDMPQRSIHITDSFTAELPQDSKLQNASFWQAIAHYLMQPVNIHNAGYQDCQLPERLRGQVNADMVCYCKPK